MTTLPMAFSSVDGRVFYPNRYVTVYTFRRVSSASISRARRYTARKREAKSKSHNGNPEGKKVPGAKKKCTFRSAYKKGRNRAYRIHWIQTKRGVFGVLGPCDVRYVSINEADLYNA